MRFTPSRVIPIVAVIAMTAALVVVLAATRPDDSEAELEAEPTATATTAPTRTPTATRVPPTATSTPRPTAVPAAAATSQAGAGEALSELSGLRFIDVQVVENPGEVETFFPPDMPVDVVAGIFRAEQPNRVTFFFAPPPPFPAMTGSTAVGTAFTEDGGTGRATGSAVIDGEPTNFLFEFSLTARSLSGTVTVTGAAGETMLLMTWSQ